MFHDPQAKVFSLFLEVLVDFINFLAEELEEWIPTCLNRLLTKVGADLLGSVQIKVQRALKSIRLVIIFWPLFNLIIARSCLYKDIWYTVQLLRKLHDFISSLHLFLKISYNGWEWAKSLRLMLLQIFLQMLELSMHIWPKRAVFTQISILLVLKVVKGEMVPEGCEFIFYFLNRTW